MYVSIRDGNNGLISFEYVNLPRATGTLGQLREAMARKGNPAAYDSYLIHAARCLSDACTVEQHPDDDMCLLCITYDSIEGKTPQGQCAASWKDVCRRHDTIDMPISHDGRYHDCSPYQWPSPPNATAYVRRPRTQQAPPSPVTDAEMVTVFVHSARGPATRW